MGRAAVEALLALTSSADGARTKRRLIKIDCPLVVRDSVGRRPPDDLA
jgi:DNA-binding LacI/PurR family transcriptional regulator